MGSLRDDPGSTLHPGFVIQETPRCPREGARTVKGRLNPRGELALKRPWGAADLRERFAAGIDRLVYSKVSQMLIDSALVAIALLTAYLLRFDGALPDPFPLQFERVLPVALLAYFSINLVTGVYNRVWRFFGLLDAAAVAWSVFFAFVLSFAWRLFDPGVFAGTVVPIGVLAIHPFLVFAALVGARLVRRVLYARRTDARHAAVPSGHCKRLLVAGAGEAGLHLLHELRETDFEVVGFLDDDQELQGRTIGGWRVLGTTHDLESVVRAHHVDEVILCMPSAPRRSCSASSRAARESRSRPRRCRRSGKSCRAARRSDSSGP